MKLSELGRWNELYKCDQCKRTVHRRDTFIVVDKKDRYRKKRLCRDCQVGFYLDELKGSSSELRHNFKLWSKNVKEESI